MGATLADIATGNTSLADFLFLVAGVAAAIAAVIRLLATNLDAALVAAAVACVAFAFLVV